MNKRFSYLSYIDGETAQLINVLQVVMTWQTEVDDDTERLLSVK